MKKNRGTLNFWWWFHLTHVGGFLKWWYIPNKPMGFPTKNDQHLGCEIGGKTPICRETSNFRKELNTPQIEWNEAFYQGAAPWHLSNSSLACSRHREFDAQTAVFLKIWVNCVGTRYHPEGLTACPSKMVGWKITFLLGREVFRGELLNFRGVCHSHLSHERLMEYKEMEIESLLKKGQKSELGRFGQAKSREGLNLSYHVHIYCIYDIFIDIYTFVIYIYICTTSTYLYTMHLSICHTASNADCFCEVDGTQSDTATWVLVGPCLEPLGVHAVGSILCIYFLRLNQHFPIFEWSQNRSFAF